MNWKLKINKRFTKLLHIVVWVLIFSLPYIFMSEFASPKDKEELVYQKLNTATNFLWMAFFYVNAFVLVPVLFYRKKYVAYLCALLLSFCLIMLIHGALFKPFVDGHSFNFFKSSAHNIVPFLFTVLVSMVYTMVVDKMKADLSAATIKQEQLKTELSFLRSQISPHFLFNVLNNMVAMVRLKSEELESTIIKLSSLMQYMLYETDEEKVLLRNEVEYLQSYIDLQQQRFGGQMNLHVAMNVKEDWHTIEPMLLIPFVENAFKHGAGLVENPETTIDLTVAGNQLHFTVKNNYKATDVVKDKTSGIGLANVKRRLELLYGNSHQLIIDKTENTFTISLQLTFKS